MHVTRAVAILAATFAVLIAAFPAKASTLSVIGASTKVCQLTGQADWLTGQPTNAQTLTRNSLRGIDLGFPVEGPANSLYFLFGDAIPNGHPPLSLPNIPPDDALGRTTRTAAPDSATCLDLRLFGSGGRAGLGHPVVTPAIQQGAYNVPTGGVYVGDRLFAFFWTNHCILSNPYGPNPGAPLLLPGASAICPETAVSNSFGRSVLAYALDANPLAFTQVGPPPANIAGAPQMPNGFAYVTAAAPRPVRALNGPEIPVFGVARYRASIPYLAMAPQATFGAVSTWRFYGGQGIGGGPTWLTYQQWQSGQGGAQWAPPAGAELYANSANSGSPTTDERCVGEHSVTWNAALGVWLMLYTCGGEQVQARTAPNPWGPWSAPTVLLSSVADPSLRCTLFWAQYGTPCPGLTSEQPPPLTFGYFYAPSVMSRYTRAMPAPGQSRQATIYWLLSTWNPYQVVVMQSTLRLTP